MSTVKTRVVVFAPSSLYLRDVQFFVDGQVKSGRVINGGWDFEVRNGECLCKAGKDIVSRWKAPPTLRHIEVPSHFGDDYNAAILWAKNAIKKPNAFTQRKPLDPAFVKDVKRTAQRKDAAVKNVAKHGDKITLSIKERK